jgi:hypothetical protein
MTNPSIWTTVLLAAFLAVGTSACQRNDTGEAGPAASEQQQEPADSGTANQPAEGEAETGGESGSDSGSK